MCECVNTVWVALCYKEHLMCEIDSHYAALIPLSTLSTDIYKRCVSDIHQFLCISTEVLNKFKCPPAFRCLVFWNIVSFIDWHAHHMHLYFNLSEKQSTVPFENSKSLKDQKPGTLLYQLQTIVLYR